MSGFVEALKGAAQNPDSPMASEFIRRVQSGQMNDEITAAGLDPSKFVKQAPTPVTPEDPNAIKTDSGKTIIGGPIGGVIKKTSADITQRAKNVASDIVRPAEISAQDKVNGVSPFNRGVHEATATVEAGLRTAGNVAGGVLDAINNLTPGPVKKYLADQVQKFSQGTILGDNKTIAQRFKDMSDLLAEHPEAAKDISAITDILGLLGTKATAEKIGQTNIPKLASDVIDRTKTAASTVADSINPTSKVKQVVNKLTSGKTKEEILATSAEDLHKLSPPERKVYFDTQKQAIEENSSNLEGKVKSDLEAKANASQAEAEKLQRDLAVASRDEVLNLRPKIRTALGQQSQEYRRLVEEELAPHRDIGIHNEDVSKFVDNKYSADPAQAQAVKNKLGLGNVTPGENGLPTVQTGEPNTTIGQIYDKAKSMGQDLGTSAKKGARVYTVDEKLTDDSISTLNDFLKSKGVDLKTANQFWAKYAPIRNQLVSEAKPFLQASTQTKTFANTLTRVVQGKDVNNENFIKEVESLVGQPIAKDTKSIVGKLGDNEKQAVIDEIAAQEQQAEIALEKKKSLNHLSDQQVDVERKAYQRNIIKKILYTAGGIGIDKIIKKYTGFGL